MWTGKSGRSLFLLKSRLYWPCMYVFEEKKIGECPQSIRRKIEKSKTVGLVSMTVHWIGLRGFSFAGDFKEWVWQHLGCHWPFLPFCSATKRPLLQWRPCWIIYCSVWFSFKVLQWPWKVVSIPSPGYRLHERFNPTLLMILGTLGDEG